MNDVIETLQKKMPVLKLKYPLQTLGIFGSYSRGEETQKSDLDIVYETLPNTYLNLDSFLSLQRELNELTQLKIDLVNKKYINEVVWLTAKKDIIYV
jgi:predicted nucleotidyltransferase